MTFKLFKKKIWILMGLVTLVSHDSTFSCNYREVLELNNGKRCSVCVKDKELSLDFQYHLQGNIKAITQNWLQANGIAANQIEKVDIKRLITSSLDFIEIFCDGMVELDLSDSKTGIAVWNVAQHVNFPLLRKIDLRNNHTSYGKGALRRALDNMPCLEEIIVSAKDLEFIMDKEEGLDKSQFFMDRLNNSTIVLTKKSNRTPSTSDDEGERLLSATSHYTAKHQDQGFLSSYFGWLYAKEESKED